MGYFCLGLRLIESSSPAEVFGELGDLFIHYGQFSTEKIAPFRQFLDGGLFEFFDFGFELIDTVE